MFAKNIFGRLATTYVKRGAVGVLTRIFHRLEPRTWGSFRESHRGAALKLGPFPVVIGGRNFPSAAKAGLSYTFGVRTKVMQRGLWLRRGQGRVAASFRARPNCSSSRCQYPQSGSSAVFSNPEHWITGRRGYFGNSGLVAESLHI